HVLVVDMGGAGAARREAQVEAGEPGIVAGGDGAAAGVVVGQARELDAEDRRLDRVEPRVDAGAGADIAVAPAVFADLARRGRETGIAGDDHPAIAERAEILRRIEAEAGDVAPPAG